MDLGHMNSSQERNRVLLCFGILAYWDIQWSCREIECLLNDNHQKGKMMIMIMKTSGSQVDSPVAEGKRTEGGGRKMRDLHRDT